MATDLVVKEQTIEAYLKGPPNGVLESFTLSTLSMASRVRTAASVLLDPKGTVEDNQRRLVVMIEPHYISPLIGVNRSWSRLRDSCPDPVVRRRTPAVVPMSSERIEQTTP
jgi:hypothetical protein